MKKILIFTLVFFTGIKADAQSGPIGIQNNSPCAITVTPYALAPAEGYTGCSCTSVCKCASCVLTSGPVLPIASGSNLAYTNYYTYQGIYGWLGGVSLSCCLTDVQFVAIGYSYDCTGTAYASCPPPPGIIGANCFGCYGATNSFSYPATCGGGYIFSGGFLPACPTPMIAVAITFY